MDRSVRVGCVFALLVLAVRGAAIAAETPAQPDLIVHHGHLVTVDADFRIVEAMAVRGQRIVAVGGNAEVLAAAGPQTRRVDLHNKTVLPGLIDSHTHPLSAAMYEFDHRIPEMETVADVLAYIRSRAAVVGEGQWIDVQQVFITRLRERRFPTRRELDEAAPRNPVSFRTGPDCSLNSLALSRCGIDKNYRVPEGEPAAVLRDPATGEPTGIVRNGLRLIRVPASGRAASAEDKSRRLAELLAHYNRAGITSFCDRDAGDADIDVYQQLLRDGKLSCRVFVDYHVDARASWEQIEAAVLRAERHPLHRYNDRLWLGGIKTYLDGGMLTGSAYMRKPWGKSAIYPIDDPNYRGLLFIPHERLVKIVRLAMQHDLQSTSHTVGDGAVDALLDAYAAVDREFPVRRHRPCISHCNFMSPVAIQRMRSLGVVADLQPVWIYLDGATLTAHFGDVRLRWFQPYASLFQNGVVVGGGSDHMQKIEAERSINRYSPFLGIAATLTRQPRWTDAPLHREEAISRPDALRLYTIQNAYLTFEEKHKGSLEPGKLADFIVIDRDVLTCPVERIADTQVEATYLGGKPVYQRAGR